ncbi:MAG: hypothetical protein HQK77_14070 [Desulfobacterales bacterium]|nr:hypothetical protein [Desulfobacterales bacterium]
MKINQFEIKQASERQYQEYNEIIEKHTIQRIQPRDMAVEPTVQNNKTIPDITLSLSKQAIDTFDAKSYLPALSAAQVPQLIEPEVLVDKTLEPRFDMLIRLIEAITGKKIKISNLMDEQMSPPEAQDTSTSGDALPQSVESIERYETYYEREFSQFNANGSIQTEDGKQIEFNLQLVMNREYYSETQTSVTNARQLKDPLVVNYQGDAASLSNMSFEFDIDNNGLFEVIPLLQSGSGFLVLDKNQDGIVNNGTELFGTTTGNGFQELAVHDSDGNTWIDENDRIYEKLSVWLKDDQGHDRLIPLMDAGVGAIHLNPLRTEFSFKDKDNQTTAQVKQTGIYVGNNGQVNTIQQIDFSV